MPKSISWYNFNNHSYYYTHPIESQCNNNDGLTLSSLYLDKNPPFYSQRLSDIDIVTLKEGIAITALHLS